MEKLYEDVLVLITANLDTESSLALLRTSKSISTTLSKSDSFWKQLCLHQGFANNSQEAIEPMEMDDGISSELGQWRETWLRGVQMRRNMVAGCWQQGHRILGEGCDWVDPLELRPNMVMERPPKRRGLDESGCNLALSSQYLVMRKYEEYEGIEICIIQVWNIQDKPRFLFQVQKEYDYWSNSNEMEILGHWLVIADVSKTYPMAMVVTLDINNKLELIGSCEYEEDDYDYTKMKIVTDQAVVVYHDQTEEWKVLVVQLPFCTPTHNLILDQVGPSYECQPHLSWAPLTTRCLLMAKTRFV